VTEAELWHQGTATAGVRVAGCGLLWRESVHTHARRCHHQTCTAQIGTSTMALPPAVLVAALAGFVISTVEILTYVLVTSTSQFKRLVNDIERTQKASLSAAVFALLL
jgi:hypothetical protein